MRKKAIREDKPAIPIVTEAAVKAVETVMTPVVENADTVNERLVPVEGPVYVDVPEMPDKLERLKLMRMSNEKMQNAKKSHVTGNDDVEPETGMPFCRGYTVQVNEEPTRAEVTSHVKVEVESAASNL
jgi:hypothetical protein